jgi:DNA invertase Pin-like site-specific DNA recombinase
MKAGSARRVRCAIYTRVSTDQGLEQDFNSLDAQYDASQAYIRSQVHARWTLIRFKYDDGGFSGGTTDRPALQQLLADVRAGKVDVIVVYKVDRLTRSLADFAKLVELFDKHDVSFVSVTQQFNTTTSMGRLTLNVLLSFAQFEREVTSERIRDKIAASKRKGLWVGGMVPLGYDTKNRKITVNKAEAERVRLIFRRYLELGSLNPLLADLRHRGILTKVRTHKTGRSVGGIPFTRGPLAHLLRNRFYIGEVEFKGEVLPGEQPAVIDRNLFNAVQAKLNEQVNSHNVSRSRSEALLIGRIFDDRGNRMTPSHSRKRGLTHRYYVSSALFHGRAEHAGTVRRVPAAEIEGLVIRSIRDHYDNTGPVDDRALISTYVVRVEVRSDEIVIRLSQQKESEHRSARGHKVLHVPWHKSPAKRRREILIPNHMPADKARPIRSENRALLVASIVRGRRWLNELVADPSANAERIAEREKCSVRKVNMIISLAFLAPAIVKAAIEGRLPHGMGVTRLCDLPSEWSRQYQMLGLAKQQPDIRTESLPRTSQPARKRKFGAQRLRAQNRLLAAIARSTD